MRAVYTFTNHRCAILLHHATEDGEAYLSEVEPQPSHVNPRPCWRRALLTGTASIAVAAVVALLLHRRVAPPPLAAPRETVFTSAPASTVKMIDDAQLLALFPDRPVALIGAPGEQRLVFLDVLPSDGNAQLQ